jgi:hypothetical protein
LTGGLFPLKIVDHNKNVFHQGYRTATKIPRLSIGTILPLSKKIQKLVISTTGRKMGRRRNYIMERNLMSKLK